MLFDRIFHSFLRVLSIDVINVDVGVLSIYPVRSYLDNTVVSFVISCIILFYWLLRRSRIKITLVKQLKPHNRL
jgi:hypothetical protein